jgi:GNAT superfamily N-acetyltransferase
MCTQEEKARMVYRKATEQDVVQIINMKNMVKEQVIREGLPIWQHGYPLDSMIQEDILRGEGRVMEMVEAEVEATAGAEGRDIDSGSEWEREIVAYAVFHPSLEEYPAGTFRSDRMQSFGRLMVRTDHAGQHVGQTFVRHMIREAEQLGVDGMGILADACNSRALHLYKKFGFCKEGSAQFPYAYLDIYALYFRPVPCKAQEPLTSP